MGNDLSPHVRQIARYEGITQGQASVLHAAAREMSAMRDALAQVAVIVANLGETDADEPVSVVELYERLSAALEWCRCTQCTSAAEPGDSGSGGSTP